ncbi:MAG: GNAT family N-acetyltransferase [Candidatus Sulfopaludibacter sp.]|nr:GNAT family N-acetyltransferase [Candidatus Sulfopaludibacter sp.]
MTAIRRGGERDFEEIAAIQTASPEAAQWKVADYAGFDLWVAVCENRVAGFLAARSLGDGECELLNLAVGLEFRRRGIARHLVGALAEACCGNIFLEVRGSNLIARNLYKSMGFKEIGIRPGYYDLSPEAAIVMKFHSC